MSKTKYKKQIKIKVINTKTKVAVGAYFSKKNKNQEQKNKKKTKKIVYIIPAMNWILKRSRNGYLRDPDFTRHKLYHPYQ